ncbi:MAG: four helix bundle protein [Pirellulaceae bacterium]|nr:four helix bundle protein [Pirellulaceae bacterium]
MNDPNRTPRFDLENRTFQFAKQIRAFVKRLPRTVCNLEDVRQLARSSNSCGANYIEANEALSKKDFIMRIKICRKEAKESGFHLRLLDVGSDPDVDRERDRLAGEASELVKIFNAILQKSQ